MSLRVSPLGACWLLAVGLVGCKAADPVREAAIQALGPEDPRVPEGPLHRPGQPCLACHDEVGGDQPILSVGGTIYREKGAPAVLGGVEVILTDADGKSFRVRSNCAGNFYVKPAQFQPRYPLWASLAFGDETIEMDSPIYRDGSCASCHEAPMSPRSAGPVYMTDDPELGKAFAEVPCIERD